MTARSTLAKQAAADSESTKAPAAAKKTATRTRIRKTTAARPEADGFLNLATGELRVTATGRKKAAAAAKKTTPAKKATTKKAAPAATDKPKSEQTFEERDWTYLDDKPPSEQHELFAKEINRRVNLVDGDGEDMPIDAKQVQAVLAMFPHFQRSATNKNRSQYRPLAEEIVHQRSIHMTQAHADAREIMDGLAQAANKATKKAPAKAPAKKVAASTRKTATAKKATAPAKKAPARKATTATETF